LHNSFAVEIVTHLTTLVANLDSLFIAYVLLRLEIRGHSLEIEF
jgi:hypothetical protein